MLTVDIREHPSARLVAVAGRFDAHTQSTVADAMHGATDLVLDLGEVTFVDSSGLATLVRTHTRLARDGGALIVRAASQPVRIILELTGLERILAIQPAEAAALLAREAA